MRKLRELRRLRLLLQNVLFLFFFLYYFLNLLIYLCDFFGRARRVLVGIGSRLPALLLRRSARIFTASSLFLHKLLLFAFLFLLILTGQLIVPASEFSLGLEPLLEDSLSGNQLLKYLFLDKGRGVKGLFLL